MTLFRGEARTQDRRPFAVSTIPGPPPVPRLACLEPGPFCSEWKRSPPAPADDWEIVRLTPEQLDEDSPFDLVISTTPDLRKTTSHPTFLAGSRPLIAYVEDAARLSNVCPYDGWLASGEIEREFLTHLAAGLDKPVIGAGVLPADGPLEQGGMAALLDHFAAWHAAHEPWRAGAGDLEVDIIMRVGGRDLDVITCAIRSLERQSVGCIRLILVRHRSLDLSNLKPAGRIAEIEIVDAPGANRGRALVHGLRAVRSPYFAILDDDDYLLADHLAGLGRALARSWARDTVAYADILRRDDGGAAEHGRMSLFREGPAAGELSSIIERFSSHCFLATSGTLRNIRFDHWALETGEDSLLVAALLRTATPVHVPAATAVYSQGRADASAFLEHPRRRADELALYAEAASWRHEIERQFSPVARDLLTLVGPAIRRLSAVVAGRLKAKVVACHAPPTHSTARAVSGSELYGGVFGDDETVFVTVPLGGGLVQGKGHQHDPATGAVTIGPLMPWEVGAGIDLTDFAIEGCATTVLFVLSDVRGDFWCGVLDEAGVTINRISTGGVSNLVAGVSGQNGTPMPTAILQAGSEGAQSCRLIAVKTGYRLAEIQRAFGGDNGDLDLAAAVACLIDHIDLQQTPRPAEATLLGLFIDLGSPKHVFRSEPTDGQGMERGRAIRTGQVPWDYFAQTHLPAGDLGAASWVVVTLAETTEPFTVFLVDEAFEHRLSDPIPVRADKTRVELWISTPRSEGGAYLIFQAGSTPADRELLLRSVGFAA